MAMLEVAANTMERMSLNLTKNLVVLVVETLALMMLAMVGLMDPEKMATVVV